MNFLTTNKAYKILPAAVFLGLMLVAALRPFSASESSLPVLGYCPTMGRYLDKFDGVIESRVLYPNSAEVLRALGTGEIDIALIGRKARAHEIGEDTTQLQTRRGHTLINKDGGLIEKKYLDLFHFVTHLSPEETETLLPESSTITHLTSLQETIEVVAGGESSLIGSVLGVEIGVSDRDAADLGDTSESEIKPVAAIVSWEEVGDEMKLLVPVEGGALGERKLIQFRTPFIYHRGNFPISEDELTEWFAKE